MPPLSALSPAIWLWKRWLIGKAGPALVGSIKSIQPGNLSSTIEATKLKLLAQNRLSHTCFCRKVSEISSQVHRRVSGDLIDSEGSFISVGDAHSNDQKVKIIPMNRKGKQAEPARKHEQANGKISEVGEGAETDEKFMREALLEAHLAAMKGEVPVGAVMVYSGKIVARAHNLVEGKGDPTAHAEMICIQNASQQLGRWRLLKSTLYVTLEPCPMCAGAILQARVGKVVWGACSTLLGADGSWVSLFPQSHSFKQHHEARESCPMNRCEKIAAKSPIHPFHPNITVRRKVLPKECSEIMQSFFRTRRNINSLATARRALNRSFQLHKLIFSFLQSSLKNLWYKATLLLHIVKLFSGLKSQ